MKNNIQIISLSLILFTVLSLQAGQNGGYAGSFLRIGLGARATALGNATIADTPNGYSMYYNPATVGFLDSKTVALSYSFMPLERQFNYIGYAMHVPPGAGLSIGWVNSGDSDFSGYNSLGEQSSTIQHSINALFFNVARRFLDRISVGLSIKYMWENINDGGVDFDYNSSGWGWDLGVHFLLNEDITVAAVVRDLGSKFKANTSEIFELGGTTTDKFPALYMFGGRYKTPLKWLVAHYQFQASSKKDYRHHAGLEARYAMDENEASGKFLALRLGLDDSKLRAGAGMGFNLFSLISHLDYAFVPSVIDEGSSHIFSWQFHFN